LFRAAVPPRSGSLSRPEMNGAAQEVNRAEKTLLNTFEGQ